MKKLMMIAVASMFIFAGCEEKKAEAAVEQAKPVEQPVMIAVLPFKSKYAFICLTP